MTSNINNTRDLLLFFEETAKEELYYRTVEHEDSTFFHLGNRTVTNDVRTKRLPYSVSYSWRENRSL